MEAKLRFHCRRGSDHFSETNLANSRLFQDSDWFFQDFFPKIWNQFSLQSTYISYNVNSENSIDFRDFLGPVVSFPGLCSPGKNQNKIPGLFRFSRPLELLNTETSWVNMKLHVGSKAIITRKEICLLKFSMCTCMLVPFHSHEWPRQNFFLQYQFNTKQTSDENKEKY